MLQSQADTTSLEVSLETRGVSRVNVSLSPNIVWNHVRLFNRKQTVLNLPSELPFGILF